MPKKGYKIVIEGIDGAGTETQSNIVLKELRKKGYKAERITYPDYGGPIGRLIHGYLHEEYELPVEVQFLLYSADMIKDKKKISKTVKEKGVVVFDRYITTTMAYQGLKGFPTEKALAYAKIFEMPKPDLIIYLDVSPETSIERKHKEKKSLDRHESKKEFLVELRKFYEKLIEDQVFGKWFKVDGEKSKEEVTAEIIEIIKRELGIDLE